MLADLPAVPVVLETRACVWVMKGQTPACLEKLGLEAWLLKIAIVFPVCPEHPLRGLTEDSALSLTATAAWALESGFFFFFFFFGLASWRAGS